jgi:hypothetical protein
LVALSSAFAVVYVFSVMPLEQYASIYEHVRVDTYVRHVVTYALYVYVCTGSGANDGATRIEQKSQLGKRGAGPISLQAPGVVL